MVSENRDPNEEKLYKYYRKLLQPINFARLEKEKEAKELGKLWNPLNWDFKEFICGWGSAFVNICVTYPINKVTFRQVSNIIIFDFPNYP